MLRLSPWRSAQSLTLSLFGALVLLAAQSACVVAVEDSAACGENSYLYRGECSCVEGYLPRDDDSGDCDPQQDLQIRDSCEDGQDLRWSVFAQDRAWTWPADGTGYVTPEEGIDDFRSIQCRQGEALCFGAWTSEFEWGVGELGELDCNGTACCWTCEATLIDLGVIEC